MPHSGGNATATRANATASTSILIKASSQSAHFKDGMVDLTAGTLGGIANVYASQPLDTVKLKMQTFPKIYTNWVTCLGHTFRLDGVRGLYAGTLPALTANIAESAVLFTAYGYCQKSVANFTEIGDVNKLSPLHDAVAGSLAAVFSAMILCPIELVKCRLQTQHEINPSIKSTPISICREMVRNEGIGAFTKGMVPTLAREVPGGFCFFGVYETCRHFFKKNGQTKDDIGLIDTAISGAIGGIVCWTAIFPFDVIKSKMQVQGGTAKQVTLDIVKINGLAGLYKGLTPTLLSTCLASAILIVVYENAKKILHSRF